jgi:hypothetical protein
MSSPIGAGALPRQRLRDFVAPVSYHGADFDIST